MSSQGSAAAPVHDCKVWRRVSEGSARAECSCGWKGPKRSYTGGLAHDDADDHVWNHTGEDAYAQEAIADAD